MALAVILLPWAFGGVTPFASSVPVVGFLALAAAMALEWREPRHLARALGVSKWPALALAGLGTLALAQALPLPFGRLTAERAVLTGEARAALGASGETALGAAGETAFGAGANSAPVPLSLAPGDSVATGLLLLGLAAIYLATSIVARERIDRRLLFGSVLGVALAEVVLGAPRWVARATTWWGLTLPGDETRLRGSYVNANHLALLLEIGLVLAFAWGAWMARRSTQDPSLERRLLGLAAPVGLWLVLFAGLVFTESRAGLLAALAATGVQALTFGFGGLAGAMRGRWRIAGLVAVTALLLVAVGVALWLGGGAGFDRLLGTSIYDLTWNARLAVYNSTFELWTRFPVLGTGLGTFGDAFPLVQPASVPGAWTHAHNDYLELAATGGLLGVVLLAAGLVGAIGGLRRVLATGRRSEDRCGALAALGALTAVGVHEALDFGLTIPANALALVVVVAAAAAARRDPGPVSRPRPTEVRPRDRQGSRISSTG